MREDRYLLAKELIESGRIKVDTANGTVLTRRKNGDYKAPAILKTLYPAINIFANGKQWCFVIHQLVMVAAGEDIRGVEVNHKNGVKHDNRIDNLEKMTRKENVLHQWMLYRRKRGVE